MPTDWITHFGLREDPFGTLGAEEPFYVTPQLNQRVNLILHLVQYSDLMLVVTGARGSGKTALIDHLLGDAGPRWRTCRIEADAETDPALLLSRVVAGFELPGRSADAGDPLPALETYLQGLRKGAMRPVLVIDDAHLLPTASLDPLARLAADRKRLGLAIVLFGEPPLLERVGRSVGSGLLHVIDIPALTEEQVGEYLDLRLGWAGMKGRRPFNGEAVRALYKTSRGLPGVLNQAAAQFLANRAEAGPGGVLGALQTLGRTLARHRRVAAAAGGVVGVSVLAGAAAWLVAGREPTPPPETTTIQLRQPQSAPPETPAQARAREARPPLVPPPSATFPPVSPDAARALQQATPARPPEPPKPAQAEPPQPPRPPASPVADASARSPAPAQPAPTEPTRPTPARSEAGPAEALRPDESWLLGQSAGNFTVQLFGSHDRQAAERFKEGSKVRERLAVYRTSRDGKDWFVVVAGSYGSRDAAQRAIQNLPPEIKRNNPWPRSLASVQDSIRQAPGRN